MSVTDNISVLEVILLDLFQLGNHKHVLIIDKKYYFKYFKLYLVLVLLDLSAEFDTVDQDIQYS